jgi:branched-chain amino acid transport system permease protein
MNGLGKIGLPLALVVVLAAPLVLPPAWVTVGVYAGIYALTAIGLSMLMGTAGQVSVGHAAFFAIGGYAAAICITRYDWSHAAAAVAAVVIGAGGAALVGVPLLRLHGHYLTLATLACTVIVTVVANEWSFTGATSGIYGVPRPEIGGERLRTAADYYWLVWPVVFLVALVAATMLRGRAGRALRAAKDSEVAAASFGIPVRSLRWRLFVVSGGLAGLSGALYVGWVGIVTPDAAGVLFSVQFLLMAVVGGGTVGGAVAGAVFVQALDQILLTTVPLILPGASGEYQLVGFGIVLVCVMRWAPRGFAGLPAMLARLRSRRAEPRPEPEGRTPDVELLPPVRDTDPDVPVLTVDRVTRRFGGVIAVNEVSLSVSAGEILGLIGPNGAGKTTLFNIVSGIVAQDSGRVLVRGTERSGGPRGLAAAGGARTFQNLQLFGSMTVLETVLVGCHRKGRTGLLGAAAVLPARREDAILAQRAHTILASLGLAGDAHRDTGDLPFGRQRLVEVARALGPGPVLLLLDEPMAGLSMAERREVITVLRRLRHAGAAVLLVEHDVRSVLSVCDRVAVLDQGRLLTVGTPAAVSSDQRVIEAYLGTTDDLAAATR